MAGVPPSHVPADVASAGGSSSDTSRLSPGEDFVVLSEFSEQEGPVPLFVVPSDGAENFDLNKFVLRIMSVDYQSMGGKHEGFHFPEDAQVALTEPSERAFAYVHHFTLHDVNARGYVRACCLSYVTFDPRKIVTCFSEMMAHFGKVSSYLKYGNRLQFEADLAMRHAELIFTRQNLARLQEANEIKADDPSSVTVETIDGLLKETRNMLDKVTQALGADSRLRRKFQRRQLHGKDAKALAAEGSAVAHGRDDMAHKPRIFPTGNGSRFESRLRTLQELCGTGYSLAGRALHSILLHFRRPTHVLLAEREEGPLWPSASLLCIGRAPVINFADAVLRSDADGGLAAMATTRTVGAAFAPVLNGRAWDGSSRALLGLLRAECDAHLAHQRRLEGYYAPPPDKLRAVDLSAMAIYPLERRVRDRLRLQEDAVAHAFGEPSGDAWLRALAAGYGSFSAEGLPLRSLFEYLAQQQTAADDAARGDAYGVREMRAFSLREAESVRLGVGQPRGPLRRSEPTTPESSQSVESSAYASPGESDSEESLYHDAEGTREHSVASHLASRSHTPSQQPDRSFSSRGTVESMERHRSALGGEDVDGQPTADQFLLGSAFEPSPAPASQHSGFARVASPSGPPADPFESRPRDDSRRASAAAQSSMMLRSTSLPAPGRAQSVGNIRRPAALGRRNESLLLSIARLSSLPVNSLDCLDDLVCAIFPLESATLQWSLGWAGQGASKHHGAGVDVPGPDADASEFRRKGKDVTASRGEPNPLLSTSFASRFARLHRDRATSQSTVASDARPIPTENGLHGAAGEGHEEGGVADVQRLVHCDGHCHRGDVFSPVCAAANRAFKTQSGAEVKTGQGLLHFRNRFSFAKHAAFAVLTGRPLIVHASHSNEDVARTIINALTVFIPGHSRAMEVVPWRTKPISLADMACVRLLGLAKPSPIPKAVERYCAVLDVETETLLAPTYNGTYLESLLSKPRHWKEDEAFLAHVHSVLYELAAKSMILFALHYSPSSALGSHPTPHAATVAAELASASMGQQHAETSGGAAAVGDHFAHTSLASQSVGGLPAFARAFPASDGRKVSVATEEAYQHYYGSGLYPGGHGAPFSATASAAMARQLFVRQPSLTGSNVPAHFAQGPGGDARGQPSPVEGRPPSQAPTPSAVTSSDEPVAASPARVASPVPAAGPPEGAKSIDTPPPRPPQRTSGGFGGFTLPFSFQSLANFAFGPSQPQHGTPGNPTGTPRAPGVYATATSPGVAAASPQSREPSGETQPSQGGSSSSPPPVRRPRAHTEHHGPVELEVSAGDIEIIEHFLDVIARQHYAEFVHRIRAVGIEHDEREVAGNLGNGAARQHAQGHLLCGMRSPVPTTMRLDTRRNAVFRNGQPVNRKISRPGP